MAEDTQHDPLAGNEEQPASTPMVAEPDALGAGFFDTDDDDSSQPDGQSEESQETEETPQSNKTKPDEGRLRWEDYTKKTQELAEQRRAWEQERQQREDAFLQKQEQWMEQQRQSLSPQTQQSNLSERVRQAANSPELSNEDRMGLGVIADLAAQLEEQNAQLKQLAEFRQQVEPQFQQTTEQLKSLTAAQQSVLMASLREQYDDAVGTFGEEATKSSGDFIRRNIESTNPATGKQFTIPELVAMATGKSLQEARDARGRFTTQQRAAKNGAASRGTHPSSSPSGGPQTRAQALAELKGTGLM